MSKQSVNAPPVTESVISEFKIPMWLMREPSSPHIRWDWKPPTLEIPVCQMCTADQMTLGTYNALCSELRIDPAPHRKVWEFAFILSAIKCYVKPAPGKKLLGFGVGKEPMPALFASYGANVTATDAPVDGKWSAQWGASDQHSSSLSELRRIDIISDQEFYSRVRFQPVDMNSIPNDLREFDACWSSCALEHLGGIENGLQFIENSLDTLKAGGYAIHTTEFNLSSNTNTMEHPALCLFRRKDFEKLFERLIIQGHEVFPFNTFPGLTPVDEHVDLPPYALPHLKLEFSGYVTTSFGIIVRKKQ